VTPTLGRGARFRARISTTTMFKFVATKLSHSPTIHALTSGNSDLRLLQEVIVAEKLVLQSYVHAVKPTI